MKFLAEALLCAAKYRDPGGGSSSVSQKRCPRRSQPAAHTHSGTVSVRVPDLPSAAPGLGDTIRDRMADVAPRVEQLRGEGARFQIFSDRMRDLEGSAIETRLMEGLGEQAVQAHFFTNRAADTRVTDVAPNASLTDDSIMDRVSPFRGNGFVRQLTEELEESRLRLEMALAQGQAGVFEVDLQTGAATFSPRFREVLGYDGFSAFPPLPTTIDSDDLVWHEDQRTLRAALVQARRTAGTVDEELRLVSATGHPLWVRMRGTARMATSGEVARFVGSILDVSARRSADELAEGFLQAASRQIRAPLTSIRGVHRMLGSGAFGPMSELGARMVAIADRNSARLEDLVEHLIELRRLQRGVLVMESVPVEVDEVVDAAVCDAISQYGSALHIHTEHGDGSKTIHADPARLRTALSSLIGAAFDETSATGAVGLTTRVDKGLVTVELHRSGHADDQILHESIAALLTGTELPADPGFDTVGIEVARAVVHTMGGQLAATVRAPGGLTITVSFTSASTHNTSAATTHRGHAS